MSIADYVKRSSLSVGEVADLRARLKEAEAEAASHRATAERLAGALEQAQAVIDGVREDLHQRRVADWHPEGANNAALQMSEDMRLIGNRLADVDLAALAQAKGEG